MATTFCIIWYSRVDLCTVKTSLSGLRRFWHGLNHYWPRVWDGQSFIRPCCSCCILCCCSTEWMDKEEPRPRSLRATPASARAPALASVAAACCCSALCWPKGSLGHEVHGPNPIALRARPRCPPAAACYFLCRTDPTASANRGAGWAGDSTSCLWLLLACCCLLNALQDCGVGQIGGWPTLELGQGTVLPS